jgi:hypothetical protein
VTALFYTAFVCLVAERLVTGRLVYWLRKLIAEQKKLIEAKTKRAEMNERRLDIQADTIVILNETVKEQKRLIRKMKLNG